MGSTVTTSRAAKIVGIGYEGLRSYLKRGLLGGSGVMPPFVGKNAPAPDLSVVRATWKRFGFTDLCLMHLAKQLIDMGLTFDQANSVVSNEKMRPLFREGALKENALVMCWPPYHDFIVFEGEERRKLPDWLRETNGTAILIELNAIAKAVTSKLQDTDGEAQAS
ncbi:hypothetical protein [Stenotrophomonas sp. MYb57]|uniref:hypothetical protein n=1 Tax=Stenotrophomonas sp. MYb57 TaxID=1827305 RepID=UPI001319CCE2|nr:hypothetical protein [Stenotrophomonas sp. MYb57]